MMHLPPQHQSLWHFCRLSRSKPQSFDLFVHRSECAAVINSSKDLPREVTRAGLPMSYAGRSASSNKFASSRSYAGSLQCFLMSSDRYAWIANQVRIDSCNGASGEVSATAVSSCRPSCVGFQEQTGNHMVSLRLVAFDPQRT